ncbi:MAG: hypothetical protein H7257_03600 [Taibaiella sp.]|nr:hypothetical protein [Taibaiella sp.]
MTVNQALIAELQMESSNTRKLMERIPEGQNSWKNHEKSMALGNIVSHICELPGWITMTLNTSELDLATMSYKPNIAETNSDLLAMFDNELNKAVEALGNAGDEEFSKMWTLRRGNHIMFTMPKIAVIRSMALNHLYHHRGQLTVYLRLLDIPIPGMYGPSADDIIVAKQAAAQAN